MRLVYKGIGFKLTLRSGSFCCTAWVALIELIFLEFPLCFELASGFSVQKSETKVLFTASAQQHLWAVQRRQSVFLRRKASLPDGAPGAWGSVFNACHCQSHTRPHVVALMSV